MAAKKTYKRKQPKPLKRGPKKKEPEYTYIPQEAKYLSKLQRRFAEEYIVDLNATAAAIRAGYSHKTASITGNKIKNIPKVRKYIQYLKIQRAKKLQVTQERVVEELARIAYHDQRTFYDNDHEAIPLSKVTDDQQTAIKSIIFRYDTKEYIDDNGEKQKEKKRVVSKYNFYNRVDALRMLGHHMGMSLDKPCENVQIEKNKEAISFEQLMKKLRADQLENMATMLLAAQQAMIRPDKPIAEHEEDDRDLDTFEPDLPEDHWSRKADPEVIN